MNWVQKAISYIALPKTSPADRSRVQDFDFGSLSGAPVNESSVLALSAAWACVNLLAGTIGSLSFEMRRPTSAGGWEVVSDHPLHQLLHESPNGDQTAYDFWEQVEALLELRGNYHAQIEWAGGRVGDRIVSLSPILAEVTPRRVEDGSIRYRWSADGNSYDEPQERVFHIRGFGGTALSGLSTLAVGRQTFGLATAINTAAAVTFKNGMRPSVNIAFDKFLTDKQRTDLGDKLEQKFVGAMNSGRPFVSEGGSKVNILSINPEDAQMLESRGFSVEEICRFFGVPPFMIGHTEKSTSWGTGLEQQTLGFQKFTLRHRTKRIEQAVRKQLMSPRDRAMNLKGKFNFEDLLRADSAGRAAFYGAGLDKGWLNINQVCAWENLPPVEGGDVNRVQMQNVPLTAALGAQAVSLSLPAPTPAQ